LRQQPSIHHQLGLRIITQHNTTQPFHLLL
jgi:hypothetical protein